MVRVGNQGVVGGESGLVLPWPGQSSPPPNLVELHKMVISDWSVLLSTKFGGGAPQDGVACWIEGSVVCFLHLLWKRQRGIRGEIIFCSHF